MGRFMAGTVGVISNAAGVLWRVLRVIGGGMFAVNTWHVASDNGGPPSPGYRYHTHRDCGNLRRITDIEPERLRKGTGGLRKQCWNCKERDGRGHR